MTHANDEPDPPVTDLDGPGADPSSRPRKRASSMGQSIGGVLFGFEQQVWRNQPPPHELVHHARPDSPVPAGDGGFLVLDVPHDDTDDSPPEPETTPEAEPAATRRDPAP